MERQARSDEDRQVRVFCCEVMRHAGAMLRAPHRALCAALVLFHSVLCVRTRDEVSALALAAACMLLALKSTNAPRELRNVVICMQHAFAVLHLAPAAGQRLKLLDFYGVMSEDDQVWEAEIIDAEMLALCALGFDTRIKLPHQHVLLYCVHLRDRVIDSLRRVGSPKDAIEGAERLWARALRLAFSAANDVLLTPESALLRPEALAAGCILRATRECGIRLPQRCVHPHATAAPARNADSTPSAGARIRSPQAWHDIFDVARADAERVDAILTALYASPALPGAYVERCTSSLLARSITSPTPPP
mmetsp:Transcript_3505/g.9630  ORF Transcript_3505/g.9630 Transcript_3505/m.9630 type:complete len:306 (-) Transcript_3505:26-943(-)